MKQRISCRGIIFHDDQIALMYRVKKDRDYYTFPGGGLEKNETQEECIIREIYEEFGIDIVPIKLAYEYFSDKTIEYFYLCKWVGGTFGSGAGPEMINTNDEKGKHIPMLTPTSELENINLLPPSVKDELIKDVKQYGVLLSDDTKVINEKNSI